MRTEKQNQKKTITGILFTMTVIAIALLTFSSCGNSKNGEATFDAVAPPPPPPPTAPGADSVYLNVDEMPVFTGSDTALLNWVGKNTKYPEEAKLNKVTGRVIVRFVVGKDGNVSQVAIAEGVNPLLDAEAVRVIGNLPKFEKPAMVKGKPVAVHFMIPISFRLN
jgi:TonB family protein